MEKPMIEEVLPNFYRMEIPLPGSPLKVVNSYAIKGLSRNMIIDTGLDRKECMEAIRSGLSKLGLSLDKTDFFITHLHADHFALVPKLATATSRVYFNAPDAARHDQATVWDDMVEQARLHGFPEQTLQSALHSHPGYKYGSRLDLTSYDFTRGGLYRGGRLHFRMC